MATKKRKFLGPDYRELAPPKSDDEILMALDVPERRIRISLTEFEAMVVQSVAACSWALPSISKKIDKARKQQANRREKKDVG